MSLAHQLAQSRVLPVITAHDIESTVRLVEALEKGGMRAVEITLRTPAALESMRAVKGAFPNLFVAAGTVTTPEALEQSLRVGADFCVSPGISETLLRAASEQKAPLLPGVATASDVMLGIEYGVNLFKLFPAVPVGGLALLKSLAGPFPDVRFCPTGGLDAANFRDFLALPNVVCCGGSWMVKREMIESGSFSEIELLARQAMQAGA
jgi:2-dehydro-3-deoxyphosphogluconate aldolase/(4S)-4-hydroxy-2-oxoglutarate aldolase